MVFIDLSGFTAMSEKLARKGKVGAEEVTEVLAETFSELLQVAYDVGGSLLKFGGDALLLWFSENEHAQRGTFAAAEMRRTLRKIGRIKTSSGNFTLRMTVGVHSGEFNFFLVGHAHKELIVTGPDASQTVAMESAAEAGEILLSPATSSQVDPSFLGEFKDGGRLLAKVPPPPSYEGLTALPEVKDVSDFVPTSIRKHLLGGGEEAEHRQVTVGFVKFRGTDALIGEDGPGEAAIRLHSLISEVQSAVEEFGICFLSTDIDKDGGKIILTAGAPYATEDDDERMLRTLLKIQKARHGLSIQIGVHKGHVFAGTIGPFYRRTYTAMGDAVNTAARVMSRAEADQILTTKEVLDRADTLFELQELEPFKVKGKAKELVAYSVGAPIGRRQPTLVSDLPLVGRRAELEQLKSMVASASRGKGSLVELIAHAGLGKSRLLQELKSGLEGLVVVTAQCEQYESSTPYFAFKQLLRSVIGAHDQTSHDEAVAKLKKTVELKAPRLTPWVPLIGLAIDLEIPPTAEVEQLDERFRSSRLADSVTQLLEAAFTDPTLLIFEDAHWMDEPSRELLAAVMKQVEMRPWAVIVTTRTALPELAPVTSGTELCLYPLPSEDSITLAKLASEDSLLPQQAEVVARRSGGNPLFVQALAASVLGRTDLGDLPATIESAIAAQIDQLSPSDRTVLRHMAVIGREIELSLLSQVLDGPPIDLTKVLRRLTGFVSAHNGKAAFKQALIRDAAYEGLSYKRRRAVHEKIASLVEERAADPDKEAELLSLHFDRAERFEESWHYSGVAVRRSWQRFAPSNVVDFSRKAIRAGKRIGRSKDEMALVWRELGSAHYRVGQYEEALKAFEVVRSLTDDLGFIAWLFFMQGQCQEKLGNRIQAIRWYGRGLKLLDSRAPFGESEEPLTSPPSDYLPLSPRIRLIGALASVRREQGLLRRSIDLGHKAVAVASAIKEDRRGLAIAYNLLQLAYTELRDPARRDYGEKAIEAAEEVGWEWLQATVLNNLAVDAYWSGDWNNAYALYQQSRDKFIASGDSIWAAAVSNNIAEIFSDQGRLDEAEGLFGDALSTFRAARFERFTAAITANLGRLAARRGDFDQAIRLLDEAIASWKRLGYPTTETEVRKVEALVFQGESVEALEKLETIDAGADPILRASVQRLRGWALAQNSRVAEAIETLRTAVEIARSTGSEFEVALGLHAVTAIDGSEPDRDERIAETKEIFARLGVVSVPEVPLTRK